MELAQKSRSPIPTPEAGADRSAPTDVPSQAIDTSKSELGNGAAMEAACTEGLRGAGAAPLDGLEPNEDKQDPTKGTAPTTTGISVLPRQLGELKALGFDLNMRAGFTAGMREDPLNAAQALSPARKFAINAAKDPNEQLTFNVGSDRELPPELRENSRIDVYPLKLESSIVEEGKGRIVVRNFLKPDAPIFYEATVQLDQTSSIVPEDRSRVAGEFLERYRNERDGLKGAFEAAVNRPAPSAATPAVTLDRSSPLSNAERQQLDTLLAKGFRVGASYVPDHGPIDREIQTDLLSKDYEIKISPEILSKTGDARLAVSGDIREITLARDIELNSVTRDPMTRELLTVNGRPAVENTFDSYGNRITRFVTPYVGDERGTEAYIVQVPITASKEENPAAAPVRADLSAFGVGEIPPILTRIPYRELPAIDGRAIVTNMGRDKVDGAVTEHLRGVGHGISRAEELFGAPPRSLGDRMAILNSNNPNASFNPKNPSTVVIQDEILHADIAPHTLGLHETAHLIDGSTDYKLSGGAFRDQYERLKKGNSAVMGALNERNFLPDTGMGGHAEANHLELFASVCNSLDYAARDPKGWGERVKAFTPEMRRDYRETLEALVKNLETVPARAGHTPFGEAPIAQIARERIEMLRRAD